MSKKKNFTIFLNIKPEMFSQHVKYKNRIDRKIEEQLKEILHHFKQDGWDLSLDPFVTECLGIVVGRQAQSYIKAKLLQGVVKKYPKACIKWDKSYTLAKSRK